MMNPCLVMVSGPQRRCRLWVSDDQAEGMEAHDRCLAINDDLLDIREDLFHRFDIDPLADDVFGLIVFFQRREKRLASPWARFSRDWA